MPTVTFFAGLDLGHIVLFLDGRSIPPDLKETGVTVLPGKTGSLFEAFCHSRESNGDAGGLGWKVFSVGER